MKTVITSLANSLEAQKDLRFGRSAWFCIYNESTKEILFERNEQIDSGNGAGYKAAEKMIKLDVKKIISGDCGPKARNMLEKFRVQIVVLEDEQLTVKDIIEKLNKKLNFKIGGYYAWT